MSTIKELSIDELQNSVFNRNNTIHALLECKDKLKRNKEYELDRMVIDDDHLGADSTIREEYNHIIRTIDRIVKIMQSGDWSLSVESTKEREKLFPCWECGKVGCTEHE